MSALVDTLRSMGEEAMHAVASRRRLAGDLAHLPLDEEAFAVAVEAFDREYVRGFRPVCVSDREQAHHDAQLPALEAFLSMYLSVAGR